MQIFISGIILRLLAFIWGVCIHFTPINSVTPCSAFWHEMTLIYYMWPHLIGIFMLAIMGQILCAIGKESYQ